jgi:predicted nucleic acid-binding protein
MKESKVFIDTNLIIYAKVFSKESENKHKQINQFIQSSEKEKFISIQVLNEFINYLFKNKIETDVIHRYIYQINDLFQISPIQFHTIENAYQLKLKYKYSYWDSLIISSALENNCSILYTEDMQHEQIIESSLKIINPFL